MPAIHFTGFAGENRALHPSLLPDGVCTVSNNQKPGRGDLRPWNAPVTVATIPAGRKTIYRFGRDVVSDSQYWASWVDEVHVVRGPNADDTAERTYFSGNGTPKWTDTTKVLPALSSPASTARELGLPAPTQVCSLSAIAATGASTPITQSIVGIMVRADSTVIVTTQKHLVKVGYVVAINVSYNDLIARSYVSTVGITEVNPTTIGFPLVVPGVVGTYVATGTITYTAIADISSLKETRAYTYTFVSDIGEESAPQPLPTLITCRTDEQVNITNLATPPGGNYGINRIRIYRTKDGSNSSEFYFLREIAVATSTLDDLRALGEIMPSTTWLTPPTDLKQLTGLWNGMMAGISGRSVRFCEAFKPYAWPLAYEVLPTHVTPVALGTFGQTLVVLTNGNPLVITGGSPDSMDEQPFYFSESCVSSRSVASMGHGVVWAAPDGLCYIGQEGGRILTEGIMTRDDWQAMKPETIVGCQYEGRYFGLYTVASVTKGFILDPRNPTGMYFFDFGFSAVYFDDLQDALYVVNAGNIQKWDTGAALTVTAKSKQFKLTGPETGWTCAKVKAEAYPVTFKLYADSTLKFTQTVTSEAPFRLPGGYRARTYQIELSGAVAAQEAVIAGSMAELRLA